MARKIIELSLSEMSFFIRFLARCVHSALLGVGAIVWQSAAQALYVWQNSLIPLTQRLRSDCMYGRTVWFPWLSGSGTVCMAEQYSPDSAAGRTVWFPWLSGSGTVCMAEQSDSPDSAAQALYVWQNSLIPLTQRLRHCMYGRTVWFPWLSGSGTVCMA